MNDMAKPRIETGTPLLVAKDLVVGYPDDGIYTKPINGASLSIGAREVVGLIGDAGSGKSTLALSLMGLARGAGKILGGSVEFDGRDILTMSPDEQRALRGKEISAIVQNPRGALNPMLKIGTQIGNAYKAHNDVASSEARRQAVEMLKLVGINDPERRVSAYAHELSGGMAQRAMIAHGDVVTPAPADRGRTDLGSGRDDPGAVAGPDVAHGATDRLGDPAGFTRPWRHCQLLRPGAGSP